MLQWKEIATSCMPFQNLAILIYPCKIYSMVAANRDEILERESEPLSHYEICGTRILGGRDVQGGGGSWLAASELGYVAVVTNNREVPFHRTAKSRGELVNLVLSSKDPVQKLGDIDTTKYSNFNLLLLDALTPESSRVIYYRGTRQPTMRVIEGNAIGLSNGTIDSQWPKEIRGLELLKKSSFKGVEEIMERMLDTRMFKEKLPTNTILTLDSEERLSSIFTLPCHPEPKVNVTWSPGRQKFGTVSSAILLVSEREVTFYEISWRGLNEMELRNPDALMRHFSYHRLRKELRFAKT